MDTIFHYWPYALLFLVIVYVWLVNKTGFWIMFGSAVGFVMLAGIAVAWQQPKIVYLKPVKSYDRFVLDTK